MNKFTVQMVGILCLTFFLFTSRCSLHLERLAVEKTKQIAIVEGYDYTSSDVSRDKE